jgi:penicillin-binding protein 1A
VVLTSLVRAVVGMLFGLAVVVLLLVAAGRWFVSYDADLPNVQELKLFAPETPTVIPQASICRETARIIAVPTGQLTNVRNALLAVEGDVDPRSMMRRLYDDLLGNARTNEHYGIYSLQISRQLFCDDQHSVLRRELSELRTSGQLERRYTMDQILDIYLNRANFGPGVYGIENASEHYLAKPAGELSLAEAALLVGIIRGPNVFSPVTHPNGALARRNEVIQTMLERGSINSQQAEEAKGAPLLPQAESTPEP